MSTSPTEPEVLLAPSAPRSDDLDEEDDDPPAFPVEKQSKPKKTKTSRAPLTVATVKRGTSSTVVEEPFACPSFCPNCCQGHSRTRVFYISIASLLFILLVVVAVIALHRDHHDPQQLPYGPGSSYCSSSYLQQHNCNYANSIINAFQLNPQNYSFRYEYNLCYTNSNGSQIISSIANIDVCSQVCQTDVFDLDNRSLNATETTNEDVDWSAFYFFYNNVTNTCYCQGKITSNGDTLAVWRENVITSYWKIKEFVHVTNTSNTSNTNIINNTNDNADAAGWKLMRVVEQNDTYACDENEGQGGVWIEYNDLDQVDVRYFKRWQDCIYDGRPYVPHVPHEPHASGMVANSKKYCSDLKEWWIISNDADAMDITDITDITDVTDRNGANDTNDTKNVLTVLSDDEMAWIGTEWYKQGLAEHASVASFGANGIKLQAIGAPSHLLTMNYEAALDEINHAKICFSMAEYYQSFAMNRNINDTESSKNSEESEESEASEGVLMPASLDAHSIEILSDSKQNWDQIAADTAKYGAIDETVATLMSAAKAAKFVDGTDRRRKEFKQWLHSLATDEIRHSHFAWNTLKWMKLHKSEALQVFDRQWWDTVTKQKMEPWSEQMLDRDQSQKEKYSQHGLLSSNDKRKIYQIALKQVVPELLEKCLLSDEESSRDLDCPKNIIENFFDKVINL